MTEFLPYLPIGFAAVLLALVAMRDASHKLEVDRLHKVNSDLLDRLMSRDFGEYRVARQEEREPTRESDSSPYIGSDAENMMDFQLLGDDFDPKDLQRGGV